MHLANEDVSACETFLDLKTIIENNIDSWRLLRLLERALLFAKT